MRQQLSFGKKLMYVKLIIQRDGGTRCLFCKKQLTPKTGILEHLNGGENDTRLDNLAFSCQSCNILKSKAGQPGYHLRGLAEAKVDANEKQIFVGEKFPNSQEEDDEEEIYNEIRINRRTREITKEYLREQIGENGSVLFRDALHSLVFLCQERIGHGSDNTIRRHIGAFTSPMGPYEETRDQRRRRIIVARIRN